MPSPKAFLDLEAWSNFLPKERNDDFEYNLLLYKFKSFYNEVKDYHELHKDCSITRAAQLKCEPFNHSSLTKNSSTTGSLPMPPFSNNVKAICNSLNSANVQQQQMKVPNLNRRPFLPHQNSMPVTSGSNGFRDSTSKQTFPPPASSPKQQNQQDLGKNVQLFNSSYNIHTASSVNNGPNNIASSRPEIRQRNQISNSRSLISKSSERLDNINNNFTKASISSKNHDLEKFNPANFNSSMGDNKCMQNEDNIYDAVSPDDMINSELNSTPSVAASIHNLNRLSLPQKSKLETSKSTLGLGLNSETSKTTINCYKPITNSKSSPSWTTRADKTNSSFGSSIMLDNPNHSVSNLSLASGLQNKDSDSPQYANYVNIDFFLKKSHSPSFDDLDENVTNEDSCDDSDQDTTQLSNSLSSDQICDDTKDISSPEQLLKKFSMKSHNNSSVSITPASSGDLLDDKNFSFNHSIQKSPPNNKISINSNNIIPRSNHEDILSTMTSPKSSISKNSQQYQTLGPIHENTTSLHAKQSTSFDDCQLDRNGSALVEAQNTMRSFLSDLNLAPVDDVFEDKAQRRIVKESFAVEFCGRRKLRHLFLFNDVIVCAKYQASSKQKFTFDVKWYLNLNGVSILDMNDATNQVKLDKESIENQILAIRTNLMLLRGQMQHIKRSKHKQPSKIIKKLKKKRTELEAELVLLLPHLPLVMKHLNGKKYTFFLSSNFDRNQWIESIKFLQSQLPTSRGSSTTPSSSELQAWIQTCRKNLNPSLGTFLLRSNCDDDLLYGDLYISLCSLTGISKPGNYYFCFEVDSYGHFSQKASSPVVNILSTEHNLSEEYVFPLDGAHTLRILLYEDLGVNTKPSIVGKAHIELSRSWFLDKPAEKLITFNSNCSLSTQLSYSSSELLSMRIPHAKLCPTFGVDITQVCKKEKTNVPLIIQLCVNEVERRGMREVGIYRMSGTSTDIQRLKKAFDSNPYVAELLLRDIDINSVTGFLKTYLREMPEGLFSNKLYPKFVAAFNMPQSDSIERTKKMLELFHMIPMTNQHTIIYLVEHLVKVNKCESHNKMSLTNLATVLGPNILKPPTESTGSNSTDPFTAVVIGSMSQAGILYFFLNRKFSNLPLTELDSSELNFTNGS